MQSTLRPVASSPEQNQHRSTYSDLDLGLERHNSHDSNGSSNFTHRADPPPNPLRGLSTNSFHSSQPDITATPSPSSSRRPHSHSFSGPSGHGGISSSFDEDELRQIMSRSPGADYAPSLDGDVAKGVNSANHQDISPWLFQTDNPVASSSRSSSAVTSSNATKSSNNASPALPQSSIRTRPRRGTGTTQYSVNDTSFGSIEHSQLSASRSQYSLRPHTPPSAATSTSTLNGSKDTHASAAKKSRNPFGFLKKKPSTHSNASSNHPVRQEPSISSLSSRYGSNAANLNPMRPPAWLDDNPYRLHPTTWQNPLNTRIDSLPAAISLEDELESEHQPKKDARKRIKGVRHHLGKSTEKSKTGDDTDPTREHSFAGQSHSIEQEVELSLDMNLTSSKTLSTPMLHVNVSKALSPNPSPPAPRNIVRPVGARAASTAHLSFARLPRRSPNLCSLDRRVLIPALRRLSGAIWLSPRSQSHQHERVDLYLCLHHPQRPTPLPDQHARNSVPRVSLAEMQNYQSLRKLSSNLRDMPEGSSYSPSASSLPLRRGSAAASLASPTHLSSDSVVSAHSLRSNHSGISPKTSYANLPSAIQERQKSAVVSTPSPTGWGANTSKDKPTNGRADHTYQFPPAPDQNAVPSQCAQIECQLGTEASSSWMAPDSWAVQPDKTRDYLRDDNVGEEEEDDDEEEARAKLVADGKRRGSSSGISSSHASSMFRAASTDPFKKTTSLAGSRRGTDESVDPLTVLPPLPGSKPIDEAAANKVDVLQQTNNLAQSALAQQQSQNQQSQSQHHGSSHIRPTSRGGTGASMLASAGASAAAAAAGKLGLHRPSKHRMNTRPNTAGSIGATRPSTTTLSSTLSAEDDSSITSSTRREAHPLKRSTTANTNAAPGSALRNHFIRVYKTDGTFATLSCSLVSTANEVQTILARKSLTTESAAYRLFVRDKGSERPLGNSDKPAQLQRRRLMQAGHTEGDGLEDMGRDDLSNLEMVPIFLYKHADWIVSLDLSGNPMSDLPLDFVQLCSSLRTLRLSNLALKRIPQSVRHSETLTHLDVQNNRLFDLPSYFSGISTLRNLNISNNRFDEFPKVICEVPSLVDLDVSFNSITEFPPRLPTCLRTIDLRRNRVQDVSSLLGLPRLQNIQAESNNIKSFEATLGPQLTQVELGRNPLSKLPALVKLTLDGNQLVVLPDTLGELKRLEMLSCSNNCSQRCPSRSAISSRSRSFSSTTTTSNVAADAMVLRKSRPYKPQLQPLGVVPTAPDVRIDAAAGDAAAAAGAPQRRHWRTNASTPSEVFVAPLSLSLQKLRLGDNRLGDDVFSVLSELTSLEVLNLSFNEIFEIPDFSLQTLTKLRELYISGNQLSTIPSTTGGAARAPYPASQLQQLTTLPTELGKLKSSPTSTWLRYLNLSGNTRLEIKTKLSEMGFTRKSNISDFSRLTSLRMLGLMDVTMPLHSNATPDESENRRVRTSLSQINGMAYGIADALASTTTSASSICDPQLPGHGAHVGSRIAHHLAEWSGHRLSWEFQKHQNEKSTEPVSVPDALRRAFLRLQKDYADALINDGSRKFSAPAIAAASNKHDWRAGASAILAYVVDRTLYIANAGDALAVMSRNGGTAHLISNKHEPRRWVSLRGYVDDMLDVSRSFGYFHLFPIVNAAPAVTTVQLTDSDEFVIIANRTLWQYVSYQTAVDIARTQRNDPMIAAQKLRDFAISYGAEESIMVMVISVGDLFYRSDQRNGGNSDAFKKAGRRFRESSRRPHAGATGSRGGSPIGQVALVFTDIKNSTSLWETNNGMQTAMRLHNYLLRRQLRTIGGYEVKTEGDAFMVSFPSVTAALLWCFTVQQQLLQEDWPREILDSEDGKEVYDQSGELIHRGLSVRMGIHWGRPVCEADPITRRMDYFGPMVNRAARISGAATSSAAGAGNEGEQLKKTDEELDEDAFPGRTPTQGTRDARDAVACLPQATGRRLEQAKTDDAPDAPTAQVYEPTVQLLDIEDVKQVGMLCLRLEYLSNSTVCPGIFAAQNEAERSKPSTPSGETTRNPMDGDVSDHKQGTETAVAPVLSHQARRKGVEAMLSMHPELLIYGIRDDATDEELAGILDQLTTRIQNAVSSLMLNVLREKTANGTKELGADPSVLELLNSLLSQPPPRAPALTAAAATVVEPANKSS
ncbi:probable Adenylate cyclase [Ustilago trichophora]|uniref:Adenylate cyclase n=1 Tax=Ustilago trichophora TaxID=86804 RepID=A0A5C3E7L5_9BASI|nr:probable Adenylate cyclase [Ustilago trichophora]